MLGVTDLLCEYSSTPLCVDNHRPGFSWRIESDEFGVNQLNYRLQIAESVPDFENALLFDGGTVESSESVNVSYAGPGLQPLTRYYFRVFVGTTSGSTVSESSYFDTGLMSPDNWKAKWISAPFPERRKAQKPVYYFREEFECRDEAARAVIYSSALGVYEIRINGIKAGDSFFAPGLTSYKKRIQYQACEVTELLKPGLNEITVLLADGWYRGPFTFMNLRNLWGNRTALLFQMHILHEDGEEQLVTSGEGWSVSKRGPVRFSEFYYGEDYDARLEPDLESGALFEPSLGAMFASVFKGPGNKILCADQGEPVRIIDEIVPKQIIHTPAGELVFDLGCNIAGIVRLRLKNTSPGQVIRVSHAEVLDSDGNFYTANLRKARAAIEYICKGAATEEYSPCFTYMGFRYVKLEGYDAAEPETVTGLVLSSDIKPTGSFECSDPLINLLQQNIVRGQKANFIDIPTDCPQRDERMGYTGDAQLFAPTACFNGRTLRFFRKWLADLRADQGKNGIVDMTVPREIRIPFLRMKSAGWGDAAVIIPWTLYCYYGDKEILSESYVSMKNWVEYSARRASRLRFGQFLSSAGIKETERYIWGNDGHLGDWLAPGEDKPAWIARKPWVATACFAHSADILSRTAGILGNAEDAGRYRLLFGRIRTAFCAKFVGPDGHITDGFQTAYALALRFGLLPDELRAAAAEDLRADIRKNDNRLTTGFLGTPHLCFALSDHGCEETAWDLLFQDQCPSWLYPLKRGATSMWERWDAIRPDGSINESLQGSDNMVSFNHYAYGAVGEWLYTRVAGLNPDPEFPGFRGIIYRPLISSRLKFAQAEYESLYGRIFARWERQDGRVGIILVIPPGSFATIHLTEASRAGLLINGDLLDDSLHASNIGEDAGKLVFRLESGEYRIGYEE